MVVAPPASQAPLLTDAPAFAPDFSASGHPNQTPRTPRFFCASFALLLRFLELMAVYYPGWVARFYCDFASVPKELRAQLEALGAQVLPSQGFPDQAIIGGARNERGGHDDLGAQEIRRARGQTRIANKVTLSTLARRGAGRRGGVRAHTHTAQGECSAVAQSFGPVHAACRVRCSMLRWSRRVPVCLAPDPRLARHLSPCSQGSSSRQTQTSRGDELRSDGVATGSKKKSWRDR